MLSAPARLATTASAKVSQLDEQQHISGTVAAAVNTAATTASAAAAKASAAATATAGSAFRAMQEARTAAAKAVQGNKSA
jgi:hypothetical protein